VREENPGKIAMCYLNLLRFKNILSLPSGSPIAYGFEDDKGENMLL